MSNLNFNGEVFIQINCAHNYLVDDMAVYELTTLYFHYKGFADYYRKLDEPMGTCLDEAFLYADPERVYVDGLAEMDAAAVRRFRQVTHDGADFYTQKFHLHTGKVNGEDLCIEYGSYFDLCRKILMSNIMVYASQSDLDALAKQYGIPKNTEILDDFNDMYSESLENDSLYIVNKETELSAKENDALKTKEQVINSSMNDELLIFLKSIITDYPEATTKDIVHHCFADHNSNGRLKRKVKELAESLGAERDSATTKRTPEKIKYMQDAPKYR